jgi:hypothetical protein
VVVKSSRGRTANAPRARRRPTGLGIVAMTVVAASIVALIAGPQALQDAGLAAIVLGCPVYLGVPPDGPARSGHERDDGTHGLASRRPHPRTRLHRQSGRSLRGGVGTGTSPLPREELPAAGCLSPARTSPRRTSTLPARRGFKKPPDLPQHALPAVVAQQVDLQTSQSPQPVHGATTAPLFVPKLRPLSRERFGPIIGNRPAPLDWTRRCPLRPRASRCRTSLRRLPASVVAAGPRIRSACSRQYGSSARPAGARRGQLPSARSTQYTRRSARGLNEPDRDHPREPTPPV